jgi:coenzyme F420-reducing hydrogenase delta subunit
MMPPSLIDFVLSRDLADGVVVAGCAESACYNRLGIQWTEQRFAGQRDPYLRARVPRDRIATIWASALEVTKAQSAIAAFAAYVAGLPPLRLRSPLPVSPMSGVARTAVKPVTETPEAAELKGDS